jgi:hypothetical protein
MLTFYEFNELLLNESTISQWLKQKKQAKWAEPPEELETYLPGSNITNDVDLVLNRIKDSSWVNEMRQHTDPSPIIKWLAYQELKNYKGTNFAKDFLARKFEFTSGPERDLHYNQGGVTDYLTAKLNPLGIDYDKNVISKLNNPALQFDEIKRDAQYWHQHVVGKRRIPSEEPGTPVVEFKNGWAWVTLDKEYCTKEGKAMGHCGNAARKPGDNILSLRDNLYYLTDGKNILYKHENEKAVEKRKGELLKKMPHMAERYDIRHRLSHLTFIINNKMLGESKAPRNSKWNEYEAGLEPYIIALLESPFIEFIKGGGYKPEANFHLTDLDENKQKALRKKKPGLNNVFLYLLKTGTPVEEIADPKIAPIESADEKYIYFTDLKRGNDRFNSKIRDSAEKSVDKILESLRKVLFGLFEKQQPKELDKKFVDNFLKPIHKINKKLEHEPNRIEVLKTFLKHKVEGGIDLVRWAMQGEYKPKNFTDELKDAFAGEGFKIVDGKIALPVSKFDNKSVREIAPREISRLISEFTQSAWNKLDSYIVSPGLTAHEREKGVEWKGFSYDTWLYKTILSRFMHFWEKELDVSHSDTEWHVREELEIARIAVKKGISYGKAHGIHSRQSH